MAKDEPNYYRCSDCNEIVPLGGKELGYIAVWWCKKLKKRANRDRYVYHPCFVEKVA